MKGSEDRQCPVCHKWFMTREQRDHHIDIRHPGREWCLHCGSYTCQHAERHNTTYGQS